MALKSSIEATLEELSLSDSINYTKVVDKHSVKRLTLSRRH